MSLLSTKYDDLLKTIPHFKAYPAMLPFVGSNYESANHKKLLLIGESNYLPQKSEINKNHETWYNGNQSTLSAEEVCYIDCRGLLCCNWKSAGHKIYREINRCLQNVGITGEDKPISHITYINGFQRPANYGKTFKHLCKEIDVINSSKVICETIRVIKPNVIVFVSKCAWDAFRPHLDTKDTDVYIDFVSHPADHFHWQKKGYSNGHNKFIKILESKFMLQS